MSRAIRIALAAIALLCIPLIVDPQLVGTSAADPGALMIVTGLAAMFWPEAKKNRRNKVR